MKNVNIPINEICSILKIILLKTGRFNDLTIKVGNNEINKFDAHLVAIEGEGPKGSGTVRNIFVEYKTNGTPLNINNAIKQLGFTLFSRKKNDSPIPLIVAPYLNKKARDLCVEQNFNYLDLQGNFYLNHGNHYIEITTPNKISKKAKNKTVFSESGKRILLTMLLDPQKWWSGIELSKASKVSPGGITRVKRALEDQLYLETVDRKFKLNNPSEIFSKWRNLEDFNARTTVYEYSFLEIDPYKKAQKIKSLLKTSLNENQITKLAFTQWFGANLRRAHTNVDIVSVYVDYWNNELLKNQIGIRRVDSGGDLKIIVPTTDIVFYGVNEVEEFPVVNDLQLCLDLQHAGQRGHEQVDELLNLPELAFLKTHNEDLF